MAIGFHKTRKDLISALVERVIGLSCYFYPAPQPATYIAEGGEVEARITASFDRDSQFDQIVTGLSAPSPGFRTIQVTHRVVTIVFQVKSFDPEVDANEYAMMLSSRLYRDDVRELMRAQGMAWQGGSGYVEVPFNADHRAISTVEFSLQLGICDEDIEDLVDTDTYIESVELVDDTTTL